MLKNKKIISFGLMLIFSAVLFAGCGEKTQIEKAQAKIISIGEQFLDYELTIGEATEQLESVAIPSTNGIGASALSVDKNHLIYLIGKTDTNSKIFDEIKEDIQHIKKRDYK